jgi:hypothetical protein
VTTAYIDLRFTDTDGRRHVVYAAMRDSGLWDVRGIVAGRPFTKECDGWQSVERTVLWLRRHAHEPAPYGPRLSGAVAAGIALLMLLSAGPAYAQLQPAASPAIQDFEAATREYAALHRRLEATLPTLEVTSNPDTIFRLVQQMAVALRNARPDARPGEFFTEAAAVGLRARIAEALDANDFTAADVRVAEVLDGVDARMVSLRVNGTFPWIYATAMFPCLLEALPPLPPELQYRIVGNTLVLVDVHASLIVDLLPYALAETER